MKIGKVDVSAGDAVKAGDVLITYDEDSLNKETQLAQLALQSEEGSYKNSVQSNNEKLGDLRSLQELPKYSYDSFVSRSSTIDVIWFNNRNMPDSFFEVEHSTDIQNSLMKFYDLQDFYTRMFIVADEKHHEEYDKKMSYNSFSKMKNDKRVAFLSYDELERQYRQTIELQSIHTVIL